MPALGLRIAPAMLYWTTPTDAPACCCAKESGCTKASRSLISLSAKSTSCSSNRTWNARRTDAWRAANFWGPTLTLLVKGRTLERRATEDFCKQVTISLVQFWFGWLVMSRVDGIHKTCGPTAAANVKVDDFRYITSKGKRSSAYCIAFCPPAEHTCESLPLLEDRAIMTKLWPAVHCTEIAISLVIEFCCCVVNAVSFVCLKWVFRARVRNPTHCLPVFTSNWSLMWYA